MWWERGRQVVRRLWDSSGGRPGLRRLLLLLQQAVDFEPVGAPAVSGARLGHADHQALAEAARFARGSVLLVDDALAVVLALRDGVEVVVGAPEERLERWRKDT